ELLRRRLAALDDLVGGWLAPVGNRSGTRDDPHHLRRQPPQVLARLFVANLVQLAELPLAGEARRLGLEICWRVAGQQGELNRLRVRHLRVEVVVDEEPPDVLVRIPTDELLDVDAAVAQRATFS